MHSWFVSLIIHSCAYKKCKIVDTDIKGDRLESNVRTKGPDVCGRRQKGECT